MSSALHVVGQPVKVSENAGLDKERYGETLDVVSTTIILTEKYPKYADKAKRREYMRQYMAKRRSLAKEQ